MIASGITAAAGLGLGIAGTAMGANAASKAKKKMINLANWARANPLDLQAATGESLAGMSKYFPTASELGSRFNDYYAGELARMQEMAYPGFARQRDKFTSILDDYMAGNLSEDVVHNVFRSTAGRSLFGGFSGSPMHQSLAKLGLIKESQDTQRYGMEMFGRVPSMFPYVTPMDISPLTGPNPLQTAQVRGHERDQYLQMKAQAYGMPGATSVWGQGLQQIGGAMTGIGSMGMLSGGFGGGSSVPTGQRSAINDPYYMRDWTY